MQVSFNVQDAEVKAMLKKLKRKTGDLKPALKDISVYMKKEVMTNFKKQGRPSWKPLSPAYAAYKAQKAGGGKPILEFHGKLKQSINARSSATKAETKTGVKYGVYHQTGTKKMPARPFMPSSDVPDMPPFDDKGMQYMKRKLQEAIMNV